MGYRLQIFTERARRRLQHHPKFYFLDTEVFQSLRPMGPLDSPVSIGRPALERLIAQHLRHWNACQGNAFELFYWRTKSKVEVDFVFYGPDIFLAVEGKHARTIRPQDLRVLKSFSEDYPECQLVLLYRGTESLKKGDILCLPCEPFLQNLTPGRSMLNT
ncbi:MAG: DUF4143 domain-containing protein [Candidatus Latescibacteria bacterium]|nr:DUF4143 domain-containing protein [Candidatus Latescibacterota bacterium]